MFLQWLGEYENKCQVNHHIIMPNQRMDVMKTYSSGNFQITKLLQLQQAQKSATKAREQVVRYTSLAFLKKEKRRGVSTCSMSVDLGEVSYY